MITIMKNKIIEVLEKEKIQETRKENEKNIWDDLIPLCRRYDEKSHKTMKLFIVD